LKILLVGFGSIGKRHFSILNKFSNVELIHIVTKQDIDISKTFKNLQDIVNIYIYDYIIIATETSKHYEHLDYICKHTSNKNILVEKPLFDKKHILKNCNNNVFIAYNLRFHPVIQKLKMILQGEEVYYANILAGQYLPTWRPNQDYRKSYSAQLSSGGGVLRDLSHELDYINWLFGDITIMGSLNTKISDLEIESDDIFTALARTNRGSIINVTMDYISKMPLRKIMIHTKSKTIEADIVANTIHIFNKNGIDSALILEKVDRDYTYINMHKAIIMKDFQDICTFDEGLKIVDIIEKITQRK